MNRITLQILRLMQCSVHTCLQFLVWINSTLEPMAPDLFRTQMNNSLRSWLLKRVNFVGQVWWGRFDGSGRMYRRNLRVPSLMLREVTGPVWRLIQS